MSFVTIFDCFYNASAIMYHKGKALLTFNNRVAYSSQYTEIDYAYNCNACLEGMAPKKPSPQSNFKAEVPPKKYLCLIFLSFFVVSWLSLMSSTTYRQLTYNLVFSFKLIVFFLIVLCLIIHFLIIFFQNMHLQFMFLLSIFFLFMLFQNMHLQFMFLLSIFFLFILFLFILFQNMHLQFMYVLPTYALPIYIRPKYVLLIYCF